MAELFATQISADLQQRAYESGERLLVGTVVATFAHAHYLDLSGDLIAIESAETLASPSGVVITRSCALAIGERCTIELRDATICDTELRVNARAVNAPEPALVKTLLLLVQNVTSTPAPTASATEATLTSPMKTLVRALELCGSSEPIELANAVRALIGLGRGLTPAGDDALTGMLALLAATDVQLQRALAFAISGQLKRTNRFGQFLLKHAACDRFSRAVRQTVKSLLTGTSAEANQHAEELVRTGATSGADTLFGIVSALTICNATSSALLEQNQRQKWVA